MPKSVPARWTRGADRNLLHTRIYEVRASEFSHPERKKSKEFFVIDAPDWAVILPVTPEGELVMVRQFRFGIEELSWELPGGVIEPGEDPRDAAVRELREETGFVGDAPLLLGSVHPNPAIQSNRAHIILVPNAVAKAALEWDEHEELEVSRVPVDQVIERARAGEITHALMLNALFLLEPRWRARAPSSPRPI